MPPLSANQPAQSTDSLLNSETINDLQPNTSANLMEGEPLDNRTLHHYQISDQNTDATKNQAAGTYLKIYGDYVQVKSSQSRSTQNNKEQVIRTFMQMAAQGNFLKLSEPVKEHSASIDLKATNAIGKTALHWASERNPRVVVKELLHSLGVDINTVHRDGKSPAEFVLDPELAHLVLALSQPTSPYPPCAAVITMDSLHSTGVLQNISALRFSKLANLLGTEALKVKTIQQSFKIAEDYQAILAQLQPDIPENGQIVELACGASLSAGRYHKIFGADIHFFGVDQNPQDISESRHYAKQLKQYGHDLKFHVGDPTEPDHNWPKTADLCVLRNPPLENTAQLVNILNTAAALCGQLLVTSFTHSSLEKIIALSSSKFYVEKKVHRDGHVQLQGVGKFDSDAALLKQNDNLVIVNLCNPAPTKKQR